MNQIFYPTYIGYLKKSILSSLGHLAIARNVVTGLNCSRKCCTITITNLTLAIISDAVLLRARGRPRHRDLADTQPDLGLQPWETHDARDQEVP